MGVRRERDRNNDTSRRIGNLNTPEQPIDTIVQEEGAFSIRKVKRTLNAEASGTCEDIKKVAFGTSFCNYFEPSKYLA